MPNNLPNDVQNVLSGGYQDVMRILSEVTNIPIRDKDPLDGKTGGPETGPNYDVDEGVLCYL